MKKTIITLAAATIALSFANAQNVNITNVTSDIAPSNGSVSNLIDGLTAGGGFVGWNANQAPDTDLPTLTFSFDQAYTVNSFTIYNNAGILTDQQGFRDFRLEFLDSAGALASTINITDLSNDGTNPAQFALSGLTDISSARLVSLASHNNGTVAGADFLAREISFGGTASAVPEPSSALLLGLGALGFFSRRKR